MGARQEAECAAGHFCSDPATMRKCTTPAAQRGSHRRGYTFLFDGCPRGGLAQRWDYQGDKTFAECGAICDAAPACNAIEVNGWVANPTDGGKQCFTFTGTGTDVSRDRDNVINGGCVTSGDQKAYLKMEGSYCPASRADEDATREGRCPAGWFCPTATTKRPCGRGFFCRRGAFVEAPCLAGFRQPAAQQGQCTIYVQSWHQARTFCRLLPRCDPQAPWAATAPSRLRRLSRTLKRKARRSTRFFRSPVPRLTTD